MCCYTEVMKCNELHQLTSSGTCFTTLAPRKVQTEITDLQKDQVIKNIRDPSS